LKALWFDGKSLSLTGRPTPKPRPGEALVRVRLAGICSTDLAILEGYMSFTGVPGHEFVGTVISADDPSLVGKRVVGEINCACQSCQFCLSGLQKHCPNRTVLGIMGRDGAFAEYVCLPVENLHKVPDEIDDEAAVFTEPLAACLQILEQVHIKPHHKVIILGDGRLAQLAARVVRLVGCSILVVGKHRAKLDLLDGLGASALLLDDFEPDHTADFVIEATGSPSGIKLALECIAPTGKVVVKSTFNKAPALPLSRLVIDEVSLVGSRCGPFEPALRLLGNGSVSTAELISAIYTIDRWQEAFDAAASTAIKVLIKLA